eukprot:gene54300-25764_t
MASHTAVPDDIINASTLRASTLAGNSRSHGAGSPRRLTRHDADEDAALLEQQLELAAFSGDAGADADRLPTVFSDAREVDAAPVAAACMLGGDDGGGGGWTCGGESSEGGWTQKRGDEEEDDAGPVGTPMYMPPEQSKGHTTW